MRASSAVWSVFAVALMALASCGPGPKPAPSAPAAPKSTPERASAAQRLFDQSTRDFHLPSAEATGTRRTTLLDGAAALYRQVLRDYPEQHHWCAQSQRSLGNVMAEQGDLAGALGQFDALSRHYPDEEWEILQAWKSAGDLLWLADLKDEARAHYRRIVERFDQPNRPQVYQLIVQAAKKRQAGPQP